MRPHPAVAQVLLTLLLCGQTTSLPMISIYNDILSVVGIDLLTAHKNEDLNVILHTDGRCRMYLLQHSLFMQSPRSRLLQRC